MGKLLIIMIRRGHGRHEQTLGMLGIGGKRMRRRKKRGVRRGRRRREKRGRRKKKILLRGTRDGDGQGRKGE